MNYIEKISTISINLEKCERVTKHSNSEENQAATLANSFIDIEESMGKIKDQISQLYLKELNKDDVDDIILEIGEELRHILYHINDTKVYDYLK